MYRPRAGTPRAKQLEELKQEEDFKTATRFTEKKYREILQDGSKIILFKKLPYNSYPSLLKLVQYQVI